MNVLAIGAHPDDIEISCGGALLAHRARGDRVAMLVLTMGECGPQALDSRVAEQEKGAAILDVELFWGGFDDCAVPEGRPTVELIDSLIEEVTADVVYTHAPTDTHQDHRATAVATMAAARRCCRVLMYEAPSSQQFCPSLFVDIGPFLERKLEAVRAHASQVLSNRLVDLEAIAAQARFRGFEARILHGFAEGFAVPRFVWDIATPVQQHDRVHLDLQEVS
jgi:LmbE family N-acetylglucosaminyl deacetylase